MFPRFAELPYELRDIVWKYAVLNHRPRLVELMVATNPENGVSKKHKRKISVQKARALAAMRRADAQVIPRTPNPALIEACAESRRAAMKILKGYEPAFNPTNREGLSLSPSSTLSLFNFETETLYITEEVVNNTALWDGPSWDTFSRPRRGGRGMNGLLRNHEQSGIPDFTRVRSLAIRVPRDFDTDENSIRINKILGQFPLVEKLTLVLELDLEDEQLLKEVNFSSSCTDRRDLTLLAPKLELPDLERDFHLARDASSKPSKGCKGFLLLPYRGMGKIQQCQMLAHSILYTKSWRHYHLYSSSQARTAGNLWDFLSGERPMEITLKVAVPRAIGEELKGSRKKQRLCRYKGIK